MNTKTAIILSLLLLPVSTFSLETLSHSISLAAAENPLCSIKSDNGDGEYSEQQLKTIASRITVRVIGDNNDGSGTIIAQQGNTYLVVTNSHVIRGVSSVKLKTSDGNIHDAKIVPNIKFEKSDLALLEFKTNQNYCLQQVSNTIPITETEVTAAGYSSAKGEIVFRKGTVQQISQQSLKEGYQIGYTSDIEQGMSGGAIINSRGELIGINGRSAYPILNTGYVYPDGSLPTGEEIQKMRKLSWGIPITTLLAQVKPDILTAYALPIPDIKQEISEVKLTGWLGELEQKAKQITVRIDSSSGANGSGVIIAKEGDIYTVLTAAHVLCEREDATKPCGGFNYQILAPNGKLYAVEKSSIKLEEGVDLAVVKFRNQENYQVATLANYNRKDFEYMFTAGYPKLGDKSPWRFTLGEIYSKERGLLKTTQSDFKNNNSGTSQGAISLTGGYELVYSSITFGGMSGGPVLDSQGRVIGIHGRTEGEAVIDNNSSSGGTIQLGNSLGIPVSTFLAIATRLNTQAQKVETTPPPELNSQKAYSIQTAILSVDVDKGNTTASQWLERGNQLWRLRRYSDAIQAFDEAIKQQPKFIHLAYYGKGLALYKSRKYLEAIAALQQAVKYKPDFISAWTYLSLNYESLKQLDKALVAINKAIQLEPNNPNLYNQKFVVLNYLKRYAEGEVAINTAIKLSPRTEFYNNRGIVYDKQKKWELALADYNKAIAINPDYTSAYLNRGTVYYDQEKWELALSDYNKAIAINPDYALAYYNRGLVYYNQKKWELALSDYNKAIAINTDDALAYYNRGLVYYNQKKWDLALSDYNKAIAINPDDTSAYLNRGVVYDKQKKWELALSDYNKAIAIKPDYALAYYNRGTVYYDQEKWELALADYNKAIQINPDDTDVYNSRGSVYYKQKKWDLALADYNKAIAINPNYATLYKNRGGLYNEQKKFDLALADYNKAIQINPDYATAYYSRGLIYANQKKWELTLADYNKAIQINPDYSDAYNSRASVYYIQQKFDLALADSNKAIQINPDDADAYLLRGIIYTYQEKWELALADFNKAIKINPDNAFAYFLHGVIYHQKGNYTTAISDYNQAIAKDANSFTAIANIGLIKYEQGDIDTAIKQWQQAMKINNQFAEPMLALAVALYSKGEQQQAYQLAETALKSDKNLADTNFLKKNLWGNKIIADTQKLLSTPQMKTLLSQLR